MKQKKNLIKLPAILFLVLTIVSSCCTKPQTPAIDPALSFATVPDPIDKLGKSVVIFNEDKNAVEMPYWYWQAIVKYIFKSEESRLQYEAWRKIIFEEK